MQKKIFLLFLLIFSFFNSNIFCVSADEITLSENVSISAIVGETISSTNNNGGGVNIPKTSTRFSGEAYPDAIVTILKNGKNEISVKSNKLGLFDATIEETYNSTILYSLIARDIAGNKSLLINYPLVISAGYLTHLSGVRFPPTIVLDKIQVILGDFLTIGGYSLPKKELEIIIEDQDKKINKKFTLISHDTGHYNITLPLNNLPKGNYLAYIKYNDNNRQSKLVRFVIGDTNISSIDTSLNIPGDFNNDGIINLVDFSILAFWYKKNNPPLYVDINKDKIVDITDFSILAFYWTN